MTSKSVIKNTDYLRSINRGASEDVRDRVDALVRLYKDRKISQRTTSVKQGTVVDQDCLKSLKEQRPLFFSPCEL